MNDSEVTKFVNKLLGRYQHLQNKTSDPELQAAWRRSFARLDFADAVEALDRITDGDAQRPFDSDWPAGIGAVVREIRSERNEKKQTTWGATEEANRRKRNAVNLAMVRRIQPKFDEFDQRLKFAREVLGDMLFDLWKGCKDKMHFLNIHVLDEFRTQCLGEDHGVDETESRYRCLRCKDSGLITVFSAVAMQACRDDVYERRLHHKTCVVACGCNSGNRWRQSDKPLPQYDDGCMIDVNGLSVDESESLLFESISELDTTPENYSEVLAGFNG